MPLDLFKTAENGKIFDADRYNQDQTDIENLVNQNEIDIANLKIDKANKIEVDTKNASQDTLITKAINDSASAVSTANSANTNSVSAVTTANNANTKADNAVTTANSASTKSDNAVTTANSASVTANSAKSTVESVQTDYNSIKPQLQQAVLDVASKASVAYVDETAKNFALGKIPNNSITKEKMAFNVATGEDMAKVQSDVSKKQDKQITDDSTTKKYELGISNALLYYREVKA